MYLNQINYDIIEIIFKNMLINKCIDEDNIIFIL